MTSNKKFSEFNFITKPERISNNVFLVGFKNNSSSKENVFTKISDLLIDISSNNSLGISLIKLKTPNGDFIIKNLQSSSEIQFVEILNGNISANLLEVDSSKISGHLGFDKGGLGQIDLSHYGNDGNYYLPIIKGDQTIFLKISNDFTISDDELEIVSDIDYLQNRGQILTRNHTQTHVLDLGSNQQVLTVDLSSPCGFRWASLPDLFKVRAYSGGNTGDLNDVMVFNQPISKSLVSGKIHVGLNYGYLSQQIESTINEFLDNCQTGFINLYNRNINGWGFYDINSMNETAYFMICLRKIIFKGNLILPIRDSSTNSISNNLNHYLTLSTPFSNTTDIEVDPDGNFYIYKNVLPQITPNFFSDFKDHVVKNVFAYRYSQDSSGLVYKLQTLIPELIFKKSPNSIDIVLKSINSFENIDDKYSFQISQRNYSMYSFMSSNTRSGDGPLSTAFNTGASSTNPNNFSSSLSQDYSSVGSFDNSYNLRNSLNFGGLIIDLNQIEISLDKSISLLDIKNFIQNNNY